MSEFKIIDNYDKPFTEPPVPGAFQRLETIVDVREVDDPSKLRHPDPWYNHGTNHRVVKGFICRDVDERPAWFVEIPDLLTFVREHGNCVVSVDFFDQPRIRIQRLMSTDDY